jgi:lipopolysaccharide/colanic/teichoic acid biosynthesis glycosyltransferase
MRRAPGAAAPPGTWVQHGVTSLADRLLAATLTAVLSPVMVGIAVWILLDAGRPG